MSSEMVTVPLRSVSNAWNTSFMPAISSLLRVFATASIPIFLNLFISANLRMRDRTTSSSGSSLASPSSRTHG